MRRRCQFKLPARHHRHEAARKRRESFSSKVTTAGRVNHFHLKPDAAVISRRNRPRQHKFFCAPNAYDRPHPPRGTASICFSAASRARRARDVQTRALYTLSQLFIDLNNRKSAAAPSICKSILTTTSLRRTVRKSLGPRKYSRRKSKNASSLCKAICTSDDFAAIEMTLKRDGEKDFLQLERAAESRNAPHRHKVLRELLLTRANSARSNFADVAK